MAVTASSPASSLPPASPYAPAESSSAGSGHGPTRREPPALSRSDALTLAVVVTTGTTPYLEDTLTALAAQTYAPDATLIVDVASRANGLGDGTPVEDVVDAAGLDAVTSVRIVRCPEATGLIDATRRALPPFRQSLERAIKRRAQRASRGTLGGATTSTRTTTQGIWAQAQAPLPPSGPGHSARRGARQSAAPQPVAELLVQALEAAENPTGSGLSALMDAASRGGAPESVNDSVWLWLLHDDSAPQPDCLAELLAQVTNARSIALAGSKQVDWHHPDQLLEVGLRTTASARRANDVIAGEIDQGQHDGRSDVLAVGTAGALINLTAWSELPAALGTCSAYSEGLLLSYVLRRRGQRVVVVPRAAVRHRRASYEGLRAIEPGGAVRLQADAAGSGRRGRSATSLREVAARGHDASFRSRRTAQLRAWADMSSRPTTLMALWFLVLGLSRSAWRLLTKEPALARDELAAAWAAARSPRSLRAHRKALGVGASVSRKVVAELYVPAAQIRAGRRDRARQLRERAARQAAPSELELRELALLATRRRATLGITLVAACALSLLALGHLLTTGALTGGALASLGQDWRAQWHAAWGAWAPTGDGYPAPLTPVLALAAALTFLGTVLGGDGDAVVHVLVLAAVPLAALGAWFLAGALTRRPVLRAWASAVWALMPAFVLALGQGRLDAVGIHLLLPWTLLTLLGALGARRKDVILSGLVGAHHLTDSERAELDRLASETIDSLAALADSPQESATPLEKEAPHLPDGEDDGAEERSADASAERAPKRAATQDRAILRAQRRSLRAASASLEGYTDASISAAGLFAILASLLVALAPVTALVIVPGVIVLAAVSSGRRGRLILALAPVLATAAPAYGHALTLALGSGPGVDVHAALAYLLSSPGQGLAVPAARGAAGVLGLPISLAEADTLAPHGGLVWVVTGAITLLLALAGLLTGARRGHRARAALLLALAGTGLALVATRHVVALGSSVSSSAAQTGGAELVSGWAGTGASIAGAGLLIAALTGADAALAALARRGLGWRHVIVGVLALAAVLAPVGNAALWLVATHRANAEPTTALALRPATSSVPVIAREMQTSGAASRVLALTAGPDGISAEVWRADGTSVLDVTPAAVSARLADRVDASEVDLASSATPAAAAPAAATGSDDTDPAAQDTAASGADQVSESLSDAADADLAGLVARAVSGQDPTLAHDLARHGIGVVLLADHAGDEATARARAGLASTPSLESLARTATGTAWRVDPGYRGDVAALTLIEGSHQEALSIARHGAQASAQVSAADSRRYLVLSERASQRWHAELGGRTLTAATAPGHPWQQAFIIPAHASGTLEVGVVSPMARVATWAIALTGGLAALMALPIRRRRTVS